MRISIIVAVLLAMAPWEPAYSQVHPSTDQKIAFSVGVAVGVAFRQQIFHTAAVTGKVTARVLAAPPKAIYRAMRPRPQK